ncbi:MAG: DUF6708 domain-containing protein [Aquabacterium sp.]|jgi:hypothetical protein
MIHYIRKTALEAHLGDDLPVSERHKQTRHLSKGKPAAERAIGLELVTTASDQLLMIQQSSTRLRGYLAVFAVLMFISAPLLLAGVGLGWSLTLQLNGLLKLTTGAFTLFLLVVTVAGLFTALRFVRIDLLSPTDVPIAFNRKTRKVYRVMPDIQQRQGLSPAALARHWLNTFRPWPMQVIEYDWDCLEAEYFSETVLAGNVVRINHHLMFYVKATPESDRVLGCFDIVPPMLIREESAMRFWEHIRRFMQENGPPLPPGEKPAPKPPRDPISALQTVMPYFWPLAVLGLWWGGGQFVEHGLFRMSFEDFLKSAGNKISITAFGVAMLSFIGCWAALINWIGHLLAPTLKLPPEVLQDAGEPIDLWALWRKTKDQFGQRTNQPG